MTPQSQNAFCLKLYDDGQETDVDRAWADAITAYLAGDFDNNGTIDIPADDAGISFAWWSWNPNSGDTGGILEDDWETPRESALEALENLLSTPATISGNTVTGTSGADVIDETYSDVDGDAISSGDDVVFGLSGDDIISTRGGRMMSLAGLVRTGSMAETVRIV